MSDNVGMERAIAHRNLVKALEHLLGIAEGLLADGQLQDQEILFLRTWLAQFEGLRGLWPGSAIHQAVDAVLEDGVITPDERAYLVRMLRGLVSNDFSETGSVSAEVSTLPINDAVTVSVLHGGFCHTGEFVYGTRSAVERATERAGGLVQSNVTKRTDVLVVGSMVSPHWRQTSYGNKIERAVQLQEEGCAIEIISERRWLEALGAASAAA
jgi:NAD-dependent DNA ligase